MVPRRVFGGIELGGSNTDAVRAFHSRSCGILDAIEKTVSGLARQTEWLRLLANNGRQVIQEISTGSEGLIDADGSLSAKMVEMAQCLSREHAAAKDSLQAAITAPELCDDDGVACAWRSYIDATADLFNTVEDLRDTMETLDSLKSPVLDRSYTSAADLLADLLK